MSEPHPAPTSSPGTSPDAHTIASEGGVRRVRVKICGITSARDAEAAVDAGADALGFNAWKGSKRWVDLALAQEWIREVPGFVTRVALCVNHTREEVQALCGLGCVDAVQFHGDETPEFCAEFARSGRSFLRALRPGSEGDLAGLEGWGTRQILLDAAVAGAYGGTGALADFALAAEAVRLFPRLRITLAGGLGPDNVAAAIRAVRPYAVDVASGVESAPGRKDAAKMRDFVQSVREASLR